MILRFDDIMNKDLDDSALDADLYEQRFPGDTSHMAINPALINPISYFFMHNLQYILKYFSSAPGARLFRGISIFSALGAIAICIEFLEFFKSKDEPQFVLGSYQRNQSRDSGNDHDCLDAQNSSSGFIEVLSIERKQKPTLTTVNKDFSIDNRVVHILKDLYNDLNSTNNESTLLELYLSNYLLDYIKDEDLDAYNPAVQNMVRGHFLHELKCKITPDFESINKSIHSNNDIKKFFSPTEEFSKKLYESFRIIECNTLREIKCDKLKEDTEKTVKIVYNLSKQNPNTYQEIFDDPYFKKIDTLKINLAENATQGFFEHMSNHFINDNLNATKSFEDVFQGFLNGNYTKEIFAEVCETL
jgi:hypothetical protein